MFEALPGEVARDAAADGLWSTAADLARFGLGWRSLLPRRLAEQALRPHISTLAGPSMGLGWLVNEPLGLAGQAAGGRGGAASLIITLDGQRAHAALANRLIPRRTGQRDRAAGGGRLAGRRAGGTLTSGGSGRLLIRGQGCKLTGFLTHGCRPFFPAR